MPRSARDTLRPLVEDVHQEILHAGAGGPTADLAGRLQTAGFKAPESAARFHALCGILFRAGIGDDTALDLFDACLAAPSPDLALLNLHRYIDHAGGVSVFVSTVVAARPLLDMVTTVFGASQYMADIIVRNPSTVYWLMEDSTWASPDTRESYTEWFEREAAMFQAASSKLDAIRRAHRLALLKVGILDMVRGESVEAVTRRLSCLADAVCEAVLGVIMVDAGLVCDAGAGLTVIAMGKLGGCELNYSSDIDLIYTCEDTDEVTLALYTRAARRLTDALSELTAEGYLYRVDLRLRPDGRVGPLVNPETALRIYYENRGRPWEFQALLKARVVAGNRALGERLLTTIRALVFNPSLSYTPLDDIARMRVRIKENIPERERGFNIKLMAGGIRDVEFIAQALQLMHGQRHAALRTPNTLEALSVIRRLQLLEDWQAEGLAGAYRFLRLVEHRLQMMHQLKTHTVPESREEIALLAQRVSRASLGCYDTDSFLDELSRHLNNVRAIAESFFSGEEVHPHSILLMLPEDDERACAVIAQYGVADVPRAMRVLHGMAYGSFPRLLDRGVRAAFEELLPLLLEDAAAMPDPDAALVNISQIAAAGRSEAAFYRLLAQSKAARELVVGIAGFSPLLARRLCTQIGVLDELVAGAPAPDPGAIPARDLFDAAVAVAGGDAAAARRERERAWIDRARLHELGFSLRRRFQPPGDGEARARMAAMHLATALDDALGANTPVALFVLGSYAVDEPRLSSDADVIVVSDGADIPAVTERVQLVNQWFTDGGLLKLDFRLRGEGASAPLVQDLGYYGTYLGTRMSLWERVALSKCRSWWGDEGVCDRFMQQLRNTVAHPFTSAEIGELMTMRARVELLPPRQFTAWDTKRSAGGRYDLEYVTAIALAAHAKDDDAFFTRSTHERIDRLSDLGVLSDDTARACRHALHLYSLLDYLMELQELTHPRSAEKASYLGNYMNRCFEYLRIAPPGGVQALVEGTKQNVRSIYDAVMAQLIAG
jgi:glutamate-ammonia-ligase adenylyltransferase